MSAARGHMHNVNCMSDMQLWLEAADHAIHPHIHNESLCVVIRTSLRDEVVADLQLWW